MKKVYKSTLRIQEGVPQPPDINPDVLKDTDRKRRKEYSVGEYVSGIVSGNRAILSQAITMIESSLAEHYDISQAIIEKCLPYCTKSIRIGITGTPGAGKSTFIETFGLHIAEKGRKLAVLTIDPSSEQNKGSILGDKTRMEQLSIHPDVFIRTSPAAGTLGGVARKTQESIILCESAGFNTIIVETVGVGQSETTVRSMVDCLPKLHSALCDLGVILYVATYPWLSKYRINLISIAIISSRSLALLTIQSNISALVASSTSYLNSASSLSVFIIIFDLIK